MQGVVDIRAIPGMDMKILTWKGLKAWPKDRQPAMRIRPGENNEPNPELR